MIGLSSRPPMVLQRLTQGGRPDIPPHSQTLQGLVAVIAELLVALHLAAEGPVPKGPVFDHPNRGGRRNRSGHRPDRLVVVVGFELDLRLYRAGWLLLRRSGAQPS